MLSQPNSIYVCYHLPTLALLVRSAEDAFRDAEHRGEEWRSQRSLTIRFRVPFDAEFQSRLHARAVASSTVQRNDRLSWIVTPPEDYPKEVATNIVTIVVPELRSEALDVLTSLYRRGDDEVISKAFGQFSACFGPHDAGMAQAYLAEINLAMRRKPFNRQRVIAAIDFLKTSRSDNGADAVYCRENGHSALGQANEAKRLYREAIQKATGENAHLAALCWKNLGTELEQEGGRSEAFQCYERSHLTVAGPNGSPLSAGDLPPGGWQFGSCFASLRSCSLGGG